MEGSPDATKGEDSLKGALTNPNHESDGRRSPPASPGWSTARSAQASSLDQPACTLSERSMRGSGSARFRDGTRHGRIARLLAEPGEKLGVVAVAQPTTSALRLRMKRARSFGLARESRSVEARAWPSCRPSALRSLPGPWLQPLPEPWRPAFRPSCPPLVLRSLPGPWLQPLREPWRPAFLPWGPP